MRIASWNINSIRAREERALGVLDRWDVDVMLLQETKCRPDQFPRESFEAAGYEVACTGLNQWNGVAILSRVGLENVRTQIPGQPGFSKNDAPIVEARAIGARVGSGTGALDVWSLYVPNGRAYEDPHFFYKLDFYAAVENYAANVLVEQREARMLMAGDFNVAPQDNDVWDIDFFRNEVGMYVTDEERQALAGMERAGLVELSRQADGAQYTYWDYQRLRFPKNEGMRIDFAYGTPAVAAGFKRAIIDRDERKGKGASDHVPVIIELS